MCSPAPIDSTILMRTLPWQISMVLTNSLTYLDIRRAARKRFVCESTYLPRFRRGGPVLGMGGMGGLWREDIAGKHLLPGTAVAYPSEERVPPSRVAAST